MEDPRRNLPSVNAILEMDPVKNMIQIHTRPVILEAVQNALSQLRRDLKPGDESPDAGSIINIIKSEIDKEELDRIRPVVNATGIILHTGLGRAVLADEAADALGKMNRCCNLQTDLETGRRGKRNYMTEQLLCRLTGAEAAMVVNNNAGATFLILTALCSGKEVILSRGQMIEIGGSYRLPDCIRQSGARLKEVGTTNKTHLRDYESALNENTGAILRCNPSNYRIVGFSSMVSTGEIAELKKKHNFILIDDLGCGAMVNLEDYGLPHEPTIQESIEAGADIVCSSGDKLIGGPQAGIIVGKKELIHRIRKHPLNRMLRVGKLTDSALEATLRLFLDPESLIQKNPTLRMIAMPSSEVRKKARRLKRLILNKTDKIDVSIVEEESAVGGGSLPHASIKTFALSISHPEISPEDLALKLRKNEPPVMTRIKEDRVLIDPRTLLPGEDAIVADALGKLL